MEGNFVMGGDGFWGFALLDDVDGGFSRGDDEDGAVACMEGIPLMVFIGHGMGWGIGPFGV
jgi:hypothetical protein